MVDCGLVVGFGCRIVSTVLKQIKTLKYKI
jgi:hypothetical protein